MSETVLREALDEVAERVAVRPPSRVELDRRLRGVRRRRRLARAGQVVGGLAAVVVALGAVQVGLVPLPGWAPAVTLPASGASVLSQQPTKGSLKDDAAFLAALREKVSTIDNQEGGGERWRAPSADRVDVLYAGDVGEYRIALVETPLRWGAIEARQQIWYVGVRGSAADALAESMSNAPEEVAVNGVGPDNLGPGTEGAVAVVVGSTTQPVELVGPLVVDGDGAVSWPRRPLDLVEPGLREVVLPAGSPRAFVQVGRQFPVQVVDQGWGGETDAELAALRVGALPALRAGAPDDVRLGRALAAAQHASGLAVDASQRRLVFSGEFAAVPVDVVEVRSAEGGRVVSALVGVGSGPDLQMTPAAVTTLGPDGEPAMAWLFGEGGSNPVPGTTRVGVVGPEAAVLARITAPDGSTTDVPLVKGVGAGGGPEAQAVVFLDVQGEVITGVDVTQPGEATALYPPEYS